MKLSLYAFLLLTSCLAFCGEIDTEETKVAYLVCKKNEGPSFSVTLDYDIKDFTKGSSITYFKRQIVPLRSFSSLWSSGVACGPTGSLSTSIDCNAKDNGIHISLILSRTGQNPNKYSDKLIIPWASTEYSHTDEKATIRATTVWKK